MRTKVYIAGPITQGELQANINKARAAGTELIKAGFSVLIPQLTCFMGSNEPKVCGGVDVPHEAWLESDIPWVLAADCVLRLTGKSAGADQELEAARRAGIPIYHSVSDLIYHPPVTKWIGNGGDPRFYATLQELSVLHAKKAQDYGASGDPLGNVRASEAFGLPAWLGTMIRAHDKMVRIQSYAAKGSLENESVEDSLIDLAAYSVIALVLFRESRQRTEQQLTAEPRG